MGKTSVIHQFVNRIFLEDYEPMIDDVYQVQRNGVLLEINDLSGSLDNPESKFRKDALARCDVVVYMFSLNDPKSLSPIDFYRKEEKRNLPLVLVANKMDLNWRVCPQILRNVEYDLETKFFPVSAKLAISIDELFDKILEKGMSKSRKKEEDSNECCALL